MAMDYRLIPTTHKDQEWLEQLRRAVYQDLFVATWGGWDEARHLRHCAECWERGEINVIEVDGVRAGMIQLFEHADAIEVGEIQIQPAHQGHGIGTRVLHDVIAKAHAQGKKVSLSTGLKNRRAFELYQRLGFRRVTQTDTHDHLECVLQ
jgi:ribosomal protein S18 acetylase RimI-like enzyme